MDAVRLGQQLAERHADLGADGNTPELDEVHSLLNYSEAPYEGDWTLRSSLMRLAQPHPARVGQVLELTRRLDAPLHHVRKLLERHIVVADRALTPNTIGDAPIDPLGDVRTADLARLVAAGCDSTELLSGYESQHELAHEERVAVPLLAVAVLIEELAETLSGWALVGPADPPVDAVDRFVEVVAPMLDELGVPVETGPPPGMRRSGRG